MNSGAQLACCFSSVWGPVRWNAATHVQGGSSHPSQNSLQTPSWTYLKICFHGNSNRPSGQWRSDVMGGSVEVEQHTLSKIRKHWITSCSVWENTKFLRGATPICSKPIAPGSFLPFQSTLLSVCSTALWVSHLLFRTHMSLSPVLCLTNLHGWVLEPSFHLLGPWSHDILPNTSFVSQGKIKLVKGYAYVRGDYDPWKPVCKVLWDCDCL